MNKPWLPNLLREMSEAFDLKAALRFAELWGGRYLHLPAEPRPDHPVAQALGVAVLAWLIDRHDRLERIIVPKGPRLGRSATELAVAEALRQRKTVNEIAIATGLHVRRVHAVKAKLAREAATATQDDLFPPSQRTGT